MIDIDLDRATVPLRWPELFGRAAPVELEIGSGKGRFLLELAAARPEHDFVAVERAGKYHRMACERARNRGLTNVGVIRTTAEDLLFRLLAPESVAAVYALFPDPWPKKRHHKRRLFTSPVLAAICRALRGGGRLLVKSDHDGYAKVIRAVLDGEPSLSWLDADDAFAGLPRTGFELKYMEQGRTIHAFACERGTPATD